MIKIITQLVFFLSSVKSFRGVYSILCIIILFSLPGDSYVTQLLTITHEIYKIFDCNQPADTRGVFLDISKAFVWNEGLTFKLKTHGREGGLLKSLINYLEDHKQKVVLIEKTSSLKNILAGVPPGFVLVLILFLIYINDLPDAIKSICTIFVDDTSLLSKVKDKNCSTVELKDIISPYCLLKKANFPIKTSNE